MRLSACVALQKEVWNFADAELMPLRMFVVAEKIGGQVIGAFDDGKLVAFALSVPGSRGGHSYLHSQMLAVRSCIPQRRPGTANQTVSEGRCSGPRIRIDRVDIRSAGNQECLLEYRAIGSDCPPLQRQSVRDHVVSAAGRVALGSAGCGVVVEVETGRELAAAGDSQSAKHEGSRPSKTISCRQKFMNGRPRLDTRATRPGSPRNETGRISWRHSPRAGGLVLQYERDQQGNGKFLLGRWDENWMYST